MSELRWHPFLREWVITATHRQDRTFFPPDDFCPLCPTRVGHLETEIPRPEYDIAVFENRFPSLTLPPATPAIDGTALMPVAPSSGICEVICYSADHHQTMATLPTSQIRKLCRVWQERYRDLSSRPGIEYVFIFENKGKEIGVTLTHPHGQIYAYSYVPRLIQRRIDAERAHWEAHDETLGEAWLRQELAQEIRVVCEKANWVSIVPFFARFPYEIHLVPKTNYANLNAMDEATLDGLAEGIKDVTSRLDRLFGFSMPYIMAMYQYGGESSRFSLEFYPPYRTKDRLKYLAGSEFACGAFIVDALPEETATQLRSL